MNKDLETIKYHLNEIPDGYESVNQCKATYEILNAAERMAAEIEALKKEKECFEMNNLTKCPDGHERECGHDGKEHDVLVTSERCSVCQVLKEKIDFWKRQHELEVAHYKHAEDEIASLKAELEDKAQHISDMRGCLHDYEERMNELEKRPEIVRCRECKKKDLGFTCPLVCANAVIKAKTKTENFIVFDDNDFCSAGQRRESEEK